MTIKEAMMLGRGIENYNKDTGKGVFNINLIGRILYSPSTKVSLYLEREGGKWYFKYGKGFIGLFYRWHTGVAPKDLEHFYEYVTDWILTNKKKGNDK